MLRFVRRDSRPFDEAAQAALRPYTGTLAALLFSRGIETAAQAEAYLHPDLNDLHDPMLLNDMDKALELLHTAKAEGWKTVVYGDYDVDGMCASAVMTEALRAFGLDVTPHVPLRAEGYGLNIPAVEKLAEEYCLMVTVDLGVTNCAEVAHAMALGMRVIVTDHHQLGLEPCPADAVIDPLMNGYPFGKLCGAGVAFKLATALLGEKRALQWLDLAAFATVADIVPLRDENRVLVSLGLPMIGRRLGLKALIETSQCRMPIEADTVGFQLAPRLNAVGRVGDASKGIRLLLTDDPDEAKSLAEELERLNVERRALEQRFTDEALEQAKRHDFVNKRVLFVKGAGWHVGVIGLVAGRLNSRYSVPVCALSEEDGVLHGSMRGVHGVHLANCLKQCDELLDHYGGHEMAAGLTLSSDNYDAFTERFEQAVRDSSTDDAFVPEKEIDLPLAFADVNDALIDLLERMRPFGCENPAPVFLTEAAQITKKRAVGATGAHLQLTLRDGGKMLDGIAFGMGERAARLPENVDAAYTLAREEYMGRVKIKCQVQELRPCARALADAIAAESDEPYDAALLQALRDQLSTAKKAGNSALGGEKNTVTAFDRAWLEGRQGTLFVAYTRLTAVQFLHQFGEQVDLATLAPTDPRCFHTLLIRPDPTAVRGNWRSVVLLDGALSDGETLVWQQAVPSADVYALPKRKSLAASAVRIDSGDMAYRGLYRSLRAGAKQSLREVARDAQLSEPQALAGLCALDSLGLIALDEAPFGYVLCPPVKCNLGDSPLMRALRALSA